MQKFGENHLKSFFEKLEEVISKNTFDLIVGAGNSGAGMTKLVKIYFDVKHKKCPKTIKIPFYRSWQKPDLNFLEKETRKRLDKTKVKSILFVDDEIGKGETFNGVMGLLVKIIKPTKKLKVYLIAETKGIKRSFRVANCEVHFNPFARSIAKKMYNIITYCVPLEINRVLENHPELEQSQKFNILLSEPIKEIKNHKPYYTHKWETILNNKVKNFKIQQEKLVCFVKNKINGLNSQ